MSFNVDKNNSVLSEGELKLFRTVWDNSEDNLFIVLKQTDGEFYTERSNPSLTNLFQIQPEHASGYPLKNLLPIEAYKDITAKYNKCLSTKSQITYEESHYINDSDELRYWLTTIIPVINPESDEQWIFGSSREITKLKKIEKELAIANKNLESQVNERTKELKEALLEMERISMLDKLTSLYNRHKLDEELLKQLNLSQRYNTPFGLILLDIDKFKEINDSLGHLAGDELLTEFSGILNTSTRRTDTLGRWGGDEFLIIVPNATKETILTFTNDLKKKIDNHNFSKVNQVVSSIGVTIFKDGDSVTSIMSRVDEAMYSSKKHSHNSATYK